MSSGRIWSWPPQKCNIDFLEHGGILDSKGRLSGLAAVMLLVVGSLSFSMSYGTNEGMDSEIGREGGGNMAATHRSYPVSLLPKALVSENGHGAAKEEGNRRCATCIACIS